jgi:hypothetical protein
MTISTLERVRKAGTSAPAMSEERRRPCLIVRDALVAF